jgi:hypothetical protein
MLDHVEIAQEHINLFASAPEPGATVHQAPPRARREHGAARCEGGEIDRAAIVEAEIPVTSRIVGPERTRATQHDGDRAWHGGQHVHEFGYGLRQIIHRRSNGSLRRKIQDLGLWIERAAPTLPPKTNSGPSPRGTLSKALAARWQAVLPRTRRMFVELSLSECSQT